MQISQITGTMIERYLENLNLAGRTKLNHLRHINSLFKFAIRRKYLPKGALDELAEIEKPEDDITEVEIFTPAEMNEMLSVARLEIVPWLAIAGFAGLRTAELQRLDWRDVNLTERHIEVTAFGRGARRSSQSGVSGTGNIRRVLSQSQLISRLRMLIFA